LGAKTSPTTRLSSLALARSCPKGFSMTTRRQESEPPSDRPDSLSCLTTFGKNFGGTER
jgi:hypothetical protein